MSCPDVEGLRGRVGSSVPDTLVSYVFLNLYKTLGLVGKLLRQGSHKGLVIDGRWEGGVVLRTTGTGPDAYPVLMDREGENWAGEG